MVRLLARALVAVVLGTMPIVAAPVAIAKPHGGIDCVPVGVDKDSDGVVWAIEDCNGGKIRYRMSPLH